PAAQTPPQAHEEHQHARAVQRGNPPADLCRAHLPQRLQLPTPGARACRRDTRKLAGGEPISQHGRPARTQEDRTTPSRMTTTMTANLQNLTHTTMTSVGFKGEGGNAGTPKARWRVRA